ncbi:peptidylprolyl isomerase [Cohnella abietis]|uniref:peptidylprolyl isomerase n=1 Tax=Cohnella abietis TaxID=2507935 RepID=A0A3T1CXU5_9BACL|nr:peptidylprolyl isomerase [Cohnella abietis]BBI30682.1 peptidylprolyl isomerase [Cohnella abietis]
MRETIRLKPLVLLALSATMIMTSGCQSSSPLATPSDSNVKDTPLKEDIVATVGDVSISRQQLLDRLISSYGSQTLRSMMLFAAVNEEAKSLAISVADEELEQELQLMKQGYEDEAQFYAAMKEQLGMSREEVREDAHYRLLLEKLSIRNITVLDSEIDQYLVDHREEYEPRKKYDIAQIIVQKKEQANELLSQLAAGAGFEALARQYSIDEFTANEGGKVGWVEEHDPFEAPEVLQAIASMQVGEVNGPIQTDQGYFIVKLNARSEAQLKSQEVIRLEVRKQLALGKAISLKDMEEALLIKFQANVKEPALRP